MLLPVPAHLAERDAGRRGRIAHHVIDGDALGEERLHHRVPAGIVPDAADQRHPRSETRRRYRLVRALAAGSLLEEVAVDRLARQRQARPADQIIHVGLSDDDDVEGASVHRMTSLKHYIPVGKLSGGSSGVQRSTRSSGSTARVRSRWTMASNWSATRTLK